MTDASTFGGGLDFGGAGDASAGPGNPGAEVPPAPDQPAPSASPLHAFGQGLNALMNGPRYTPPDPQASALDQTADTLQQRIQRANSVATNPILQFFNPEGVQAARAFVPQATEQLQKIKAQQADMQANRVQAETLGLHPGEVPDEASQADRVAVAQSKALKGDLKVFKGLQAVDPKAAEAIQDQVHEAVAGHLTKAQLAFDSLAGMQNPRQYDEKVKELRKNGTLTDLEALGLKVPPSLDGPNGFNATKAREGQALREARIGVDTIRQKLEERNTYQPMEEKEAKTYEGRIKTVYGDNIPGVWSRNGASGTRGLVVSGMADPRTAGPLATPEQRKGLKEDFAAAVPKEDMEKFRAFNRTYDLATKDSKGNKLADGKLNTNPNVQQGVAEGLASMLRGGSGGANVGLLKIELAKRGWAQGTIDNFVSNYAGAMNTMFANANKPYLSEATQKQIRDVMDVLKTYNDTSISDRVGDLAKRAGALRLDSGVFGFSKGESAGAVDAAIKEGRDAQIAADMQRHQSIGGGDGVLQIGAQRPGAGATALPPGTTPTNQQPGGDRIATPVQQAAQPTGQPSPPVGPNGPQPAPPSSPGAGAPPAGSPPASPGPAGGGSSVPRGIRNNNPLNIEAGTFTKDLPGFAGSDGRFAKFETPEQGIAATNKLLDIYERKGLNTVTGIVNRWAPAGENNTKAYVADVAKQLGIDPNAPIPKEMRPQLIAAMARHENGTTIAIPGDVPAGGGGAPAEAPSLLTRISRTLMQGVPADQRDKAAADVGNAAVEHAPAIVSTLGAIGGTAVGGTPGGMAGGGAGGGAGQALKDYLRGRPRDDAAIAKETALGTMFGVLPGSRLVGPAVRAVGGGAIEAGAKAAEGADGADIVDAGLKGAGATVGGEMFGRALGMIGHKVFSMFAPDARKAVQAAAKTYAEATETLAKETPKLPGAGGAAGGPNPKYEAAEAAKTKAEQTLKDAGLNPEEAAYAHKVSSEDIPPSKREAEVSRPGAMEQQKIGEGYQQLEKEVAKESRDLDRPVALPKLPDGPIAAVENKKVSAKHAELAQRTEMAITAPAANWQEKWTQLKDARSALLEAERDALTSTAPGRTQTAKDMRTLADTVRKQQEHAANIVFGKKDGEAFMDRLKVLDTRYRNLMEATNGGDLLAAAKMTGEAGREADKKFRAFAHDDKVALAAWAAMRKKGGNVEQDVLDQIRLEKIPYVGAAVGAGRYLLGLRKWMTERAAGNPMTFADYLKSTMPQDTTGRTVRDLAGTAAQRGATMQ